jgi:uncharacterized membrane protein
MSAESFLQEQPQAGFFEKIVSFILRHATGILVLALLVFTLAPFAAPLFMHWGWVRPAAALYAFYGTTCHQLAQRSWFLFGPKLTYTVAELQQVMPAVGPLELRAFVGTDALGWKVAWSDRMLSFYTMTAVWGVVIWLLSRAGTNIRPLKWRFLVIALVPLVVDGGSHLLNDVLFTLGSGFRDTNLWLQILTGDAWPGFYAGDHFGTFNWWARLVTGVIAAWGVAFAFFPRFERLRANEVTQN